MKTFAYPASVVYPAIVKYDKESGYYVRFPDFENCFTDGDDVIEALKNAEDVLNLYISDLQKNNKHLPIPSSIFSLNNNLKENEFTTLIKIYTKSKINIDEFIKYIKKFDYKDDITLIDFEKFFKNQSE